ncbi:GNAT family N-acetyltransferase [Streptomyces venezuelae]|uniref:GNAT family N-acetyltransferase n=1 Tax=Streptomyces venezuelae TaxID=54571 RepID=A0A5P2D7J4_STRVZ|nr:GNAT family N-acetyltransferase [Streptomyces venezuelae]QES51016.1 GNAT family N-acetyltransferase [Streptomyces venezuelae]
MPDPLVQPLDLAQDAVAEAVQRLGRASYAVEAELIGFDGIPGLRESLAELRARPLRWVGVAADRDGGLAGALAWEEPAPAPTTGAGAGAAAARIDRLCVDPAWFRKGIASQLVRYFLEEVAAGRAAEVTTGAANAPAVALYERLGFVRGADFSPAPGLRMASFHRPAPHPRHR